jgi:hypothetical protein
MAVVIDYCLRSRTRAPQYWHAARADVVNHRFKDMSGAAFGADQLRLTPQTPHTRADRSSTSFRSSCFPAWSLHA